MTYAIDVRWVSAQPYGPNPQPFTGWAARYRLPGDSDWREVRESGRNGGLYTSEDYAFRVAGFALCAALNDRQAPPSQKPATAVRPVVRAMGGEVLAEGESVQHGAAWYRLHEADRTHVYVRRRMASGEWGRVLKRRPSTLGLRISHEIPAEGAR